MDKLDVQETCGMPMREKYWEELTVEQKIERLRNEIKSRDWRIEGLEARLRNYEQHFHAEGKLVVPINCNDSVCYSGKINRFESEKFF